MPVSSTVPVAFTAVVFAVPVPEPGTSPTLLPLALEAGMPATSPPAPLTTPSTVRVLAPVAASPPPLLPSTTGRGLAPALSRAKVAFPAIVPPFRVAVAAVATAPRSLADISATTCPSIKVGPV